MSFSCNGIGLNLLTQLFDFLIFKLNKLFQVANFFRHLSFIRTELLEMLIQDQFFLTLG